MDEICGIAGAWADDVDTHSRFPYEAIAAMREQQWMTCALPRYRGGYGLTLREVAAMVRTVSSRCAATGMIFATHQTQAMTLVRHAEGPDLDIFLGDMLENQYLLAAATADMSKSSGVIEAQRGFVTLTKHARMIAYAEYCDAILATARPSRDSSPAARVLAVCRRSNLTLERTEGWDVMGLRGVRSPGFVLRATTAANLILHQPYTRIFGETVRPVAYTLWAAVCLGIADAAVDKAARHVADKQAGVRRSHRESRLRLSDAVAERDMFAELVDRAADSFDDRGGAATPDPGSLSDIAASLEVDNLEVMAAKSVVEIVVSALSICGIDGYRTQGDYTIERHLRDAHGVALLMNNYRVTADPA